MHPVPGPPSVACGRRHRWPRQRYQRPGAWHRGTSLRLDYIVTGSLAAERVAEVSYREDVVEEPDLVEVGEPYYEPFPIPVMRLVEIVAEKLRALAQRDRPTDLSDLAMILTTETIEAASKTVLVRLASLLP